MNGIPDRMIRFPGATVHESKSLVKARSHQMAPIFRDVGNSHARNENAFANGMRNATRLHLLFAFLMPRRRRVHPGERSPYSDCSRSSLGQLALVVY